ncbi:fasciclin domain-containing protein [Pontibacter pamirensis]|uniref:fasciclin domain-containing protein n=1 Tax=Pontibacter pamirensis TaxID=2562824 RepID=UPI001389C727|nr:fasciclin domain-containing protein [Pontibacter pamirensis]
MKLLYQKLYVSIAIIALLLVCLQPVQAQEMALVPKERMTLMQYVMQERPVLANLITKAGLTPILSDKELYTVLAPPEAELTALQQLAPARLRAVISNHILKGAYLEKDLKDGSTVETLARTKLNIFRKKDHTLVNGARIETKNIQVSNGVLHGLSSKLTLE